MTPRQTSPFVCAMRLCALATLALSTPAAAAPPPAAACVPAVDAEGSTALHLGRSGDAWILCADERGVGPKACWTLDRKTGALAPRAAELLSGISYTVPAEGCVLGLCLPKLAPPQEPRDPGDGPRQALLTLHADGKRAVIFVGDTFVVFDRKTQQILASFGIHPTTGEADVIGNAPGHLWFLGETIFVEGFDAGPASYVGAYRADGTPIAVVRSPGSDSYVNTTNGTVAALDETHLGINADGLAALYVVSGGSGRVDKTLHRKLGKPPCNVGDVPEWDDASLAMNVENVACRRYIKKKLVPWTGTQILADGDRFVGFDGHALVALDASLGPGKRMRLKTCRK